MFFTSFYLPFVIVSLTTNLFLNVKANSKNNWDPANVTYPKAHRDKTVFTYGSLLPNGTIINVTVPDPFNWLEEGVDESKQTKDYVESQMKLTQSYIDKNKDYDAIYASIKHFDDYDDIGAIHRFGPKNDEKYLYSIFFVNKSRPVWYLATLNEMEKGFNNLLSPFPGKLWFDENLLSYDGSKAITDFKPSPDGKLIAYSVVTGGGDISTIYVRETSSPFIQNSTSPLEGGNGRSPESIANYTALGIYWLKDSSGFLYESESYSDDGFNSRIFHHTIGQSSDKDVIILDQPKDNDMNWAVVISNDFKWLIATLGKSVNFRCSCYIASLEDQPLSNEMQWISVLPGQTAIMYYVSNDDTTFYFLSDYDNANGGKMISVEIDKSKARKVEFLTDLTETLPVKTIIPEKKNAQIDFYDLYLDNTIPIFDEDKVFLWYSKNASDVIFVHDLKTGDLINQVLPQTLGTVTSIWSNVVSNEVYIETMSLNKPGSTFRVSFDKKTQNLQTKMIFDCTVPGFDLNSIIHERHYSTSKDDVKVPFDVFYKKGCKFDGSMPAILYFYGAYGLINFPVFAPSFVDFIFAYEGAVIFAYPRGGGEEGPSWHTDGMLEKRQNNVNDVISVAEYLIEKGISSLGNIIIEGGSAAGTICMVVTNQAREGLLGASVCDSGVYDMLRLTDLQLGGVGNIDEFGDGHNPKDFPWLFPFSPLQNVNKTKVYPLVLIYADQDDDRVANGNSFKMIAELQSDLPKNENPLLLYLLKGEGHTGLYSGEKTFLIDNTVKTAIMTEGLGLKRKI